MVGAGGWANHVHYPGLASLDDVEFAGVCDVNPARLEATANKYAIEARYSDYRTMIEETAPDGVYALGPPHLMYDVWTWCLEHGLNLYIEKPMGVSVHQARALAYLAEKHGCMTQVSFQRRVSPLLVQLREECLKHGPIVHAVCEFYKCAIAPNVRPLGYMMDDGVHSIDTVRWMCGGEVARVQSRCKRIGVPDINWIGAMLHFDNGATGCILNSWSSGRRVFRVQMHAPAIYTDAELEGKAYLYADGNYEGVEYDTKQAAGSDQLYVYGGFRAKHREFIDSLKDGREKTSSPFRDAVKTMEIADTILAQALLAKE
jgi:predicted dehydrogenase